MPMFLADDRNIRRNGELTTMKRQVGDSAEGEAGNGDQRRRSDETAEPEVWSCLVLKNAADGGRFKQYNDEGKEMRQSICVGIGRK